jgi:hypothetical protein
VEVDVPIVSRPVKFYVAAKCLSIQDNDTVAEIGSAASIQNSRRNNFQLSAVKSR